MKKTLSVLLCFIMILTSVPFAANAQDQTENPLKEIILPEELTLFLDKYNESDSKELTAELVGESDGEVTDVKNTEWRSLDPSVAEISYDGVNAVVSTSGKKGTTNVVVEVTKQDDTVVSAVCKVTVRESFRVAYDNFELMMNMINADVDAVPAKYSSVAITQLKNEFIKISEYLALEDEYTSYILWRNAILEKVDKMEDTAENCEKVNLWSNEIMRVVVALENSILATDDDVEFWKEWNEAYAMLPADFNTAYTAESTKAVNDIIERRLKTEWLKNEEDQKKINELAQQLREAIANLVKCSTFFRFDIENGVIVKNYGAGTFRIPVIRDGEDEIEWASSDKNIAIVDDNGYVTILSAIPEGYTDKVRINAYCNNLVASCELIILNPISKIEASKGLSVLMGDTKQIVIDVYGVDRSCPVTEEAIFEYECDDEEIAVVSEDGIITPVAPGKCNITVRLKDNDTIDPVTIALTVSPSQKVTKLVLVSSSAPQVTVNAATEIKVFVYPTSATNKEIKWSSSDESVATVTGITTDAASYATAAIKGVSPGSAVITFEATDGSGIKGSVTVTVNPLVSKIMFDTKSIVTYIGNDKELKITATCQPVNAGNQKLSWFSSDPEVATVVDGKITLHATGTCTITAIAQDGSGVSNEATLLVLGSCMSMTMSDAPKVMNTGESVDLDCTVITRQGVTYEVEDWSVSDPNLASVTSEGVLTALLPGEVTVRATYFDGTSVSKKIKIVAPVLGISLPLTLTLAVGQTKTLVPTFEPEYATNQNVSWETSDPEVASISTDGVITAVGTGTAVITVISEEGEYKATCKVVVIRPVTGVTLNKSSYTLTIGGTESVKLVATVMPENATTKTIRWETSDSSVAKVSSTGTVTAVGPGSANITVYTTDGNYSAKCKIVVKQPVKSIKFESSSETLYVSQKKTLKVIFTPSNASNKGLTYKSSDTSIATVNDSGKVTAKKAGSCTITAVSADGGYKATCKIKVVKKVDVTSIDISKSTLTLAAGKTKQLNATVYPTNASNPSVKWTSTDSSIASVNSNGLVTAHKGGVVTIKCTSSDTGVSDKCKISVTENPTGIVLSVTSLTLDSGSSKTLTAEVIPESATNKNIKWYSTDTNVATVNSSGRVTAVSGGTCKIVAKSKADSTIVAKCKLTVLQLPTSITISEKELEMTKGDKAALTAKVKPTNSYNTNLKWKSSNSSVAKVSSNGVVTAVSAGSAVITCYSEVAPNVKQTCNVTVYQPVTGVSLSVTKLTMTTGRTKTLVPEVTPEKASNKKVTYKTSNRNVATVNSKGVIEAVGPGQATITVCTVDGFYTAKCVVTVIEPVVSVSLNKKSTTLEIGKSKTLTAIVSPFNATNQEVTWRSSNPLVARVTQSGKITAMSEGTATITCTTEDGNFKATCKVTCIIPIEAVTLNYTSVTLNKGETLKLKAKIYPDDATNKQVTWTSSNTSIATVDANGKVTTLKKGTCVITCTTNQGGKKASCSIKVK